MKRIICAALSVTLATGAAACSDKSPSGPDGIIAGPGDTVAKAAPEKLSPLEQIAYYGVAAGQASLTLMNLDGSGAVRLGTGWSPSWSPDGARLTFSNTLCDTDYETYYRCDRGGLVIVNPETLQFTAPPAGAFGEDPAWSPDGNTIAFVRFTENRHRLFLMRLDGSEPEEIVTSGIGDVFGPSWSPDGRQIAFQCYTVGGFGICVINSDGTGQAVLATSAVSPAWSPDGKTIAFTVLSGDHGQIRLMAPDGSAVAPLTDGYGPAWSNDGTHLVFSRNNDGLFIIRTDGSGLTRLTTGIQNSPAWRPKRTSVQSPAAPTPVRMGTIAGFVIDKSDQCIIGARVEMIDGPRAGGAFVQTLCGFWDYGDDIGYSFQDLPAGRPITVRATADGYKPEERSFTPTNPYSYSSMIVLTKE